MSIRSPKHLVPSSILVISLFLFLANANATTYFVRSGASGNGTSWANAWATPGAIAWSSLAAGDTVCIAGGTYSAGISTGNSGASGNPITIKRATAADATCGSGTAGWNAAYDSQVILSGVGINIVSSYITVDGMVANGIRVDMPNPSSRFIGVGNSYGTGTTTNNTVRHIEVSGPCQPPLSGCTQNSDHVAFSVYGGAGVQSNWTAQYLNLHGSCMNAMFLNFTNLLFEHNRLADSWTANAANCHPNMVQIDGNNGSATFTFRYNELTNWSNEGLFFEHTATGYVYGNIFHDGNSSVYPFIADTQDNNNTLVLYGNTFVNIPYGTIMCHPGGSSGPCGSGGSWSSNSSSRNNIWWNTSDVGGVLTNKDYDLSNQSTGEPNGVTTSTSPFVNLSAKTVAGYHLSGQTPAGTNLGSPYNIDYDGNSRTTWDRGAFEFSSGSATAPAPPKSLAAMVQ